MPLHSTGINARVKDVIACLGAALNTLALISNSIETPFLSPIASTIRSLLSAVETIKRNQDDCLHLLEQINDLVYAIIRLHITSETSGELPPRMLYNLGRLTETLHKVHAFVEAQQETNRIKQFFRQVEMSALLKSCYAGLDEALGVFKISAVHLLPDVTAMQQYAQRTHQEVIDLISALSDGESIDGESTLGRVLSSSQNSSTSLSLLPSEPKIFHGRESEVAAIIQSFKQNAPRIAILGAGGMGKTSLARAILHHPDISAQYGEHRFFINGDTASGSIHLAGLVGAHIGLKPGKDLTQSVIQYFFNSEPSLLVLDNLETIWEPRESRAEVEKFLSSLADIDHLALVITMRGAERPANLQWSRPFLAPLKPLPYDAAHQTFVDIADGGHSSDDIDKILKLTDNMPLAIDLIAHLVDCEGLFSVLDRWEIEKTSLMSEGHNKGSNLDLSISLSLESPRLKALPHSRDLLSLLSMLPDGLSDAELLQSKLPIDNILACKASLLRTALAYTDNHKRLKTLVPIREYLQRAHPPNAHLVQSLSKHFYQLLDIYDTFGGTVSSPGIVSQIATNYTNIHNILVKGLDKGNPDLVTAIDSTCHFDRFSSLTAHGHSHLIERIPHVLPHPPNYKLEVQFIARRLIAWRIHPISNTSDLVQQALGYFLHFDDPDLKCALPVYVL
ncbi:P-loop containing nucleoside triphosphate hydrolase protein [Mycena galopus ATCC 62051]|nr:P-loop containing nucleoside triphosphate hydrolase protein [Mycena galopus ATCC 62051]